MNRLVVGLIVAIVALSVLVSAGPTLVALTNSAVPLVLAVGFVVVLIRLASWFTGRW